MEEKDINNGCGCGHDHGDECCGHDNENQTVTITFDNDTEVECVVLGIFEVEDKEYIALLPVGDEEVLVYQYTETDGEATLGQIELDEEYEKVSEAFYAIMEDDMDEL